MLPVRDLQPEEIVERRAERDRVKGCTADRTEQRRRRATKEQGYRRRRRRQSSDVRCGEILLREEVPSEGVGCCRVGMSSKPESVRMDRQQR